jgi:uncharacterized protein YkwD/thiol-disulfide isomerase/thioredoxin
MPSRFLKSNQRNHFTDINGWIAILVFFLIVIGMVVFTILGQRSANSATEIKSSPTLNQSPAENQRPASTSPFSAVLDLKDMQQYMLELINSSRTNNGLSQLSLDDFTAQVGQIHAEEMVKNGYMSHWDLAGYGPDIRYSLAGGSDYVMENVYSSWERYDDGTPVPVQDWRAEVKKAHDALMNSAGHRANILKPEHTQVGIGMAYDPTSGEFRIAQEFINHYIQMDPVPQSAQPGETITIHGQLVSGSTNPVINMAFEPAPQAKTVDWLNQTSSYKSPAQFLENVIPQEESTGRFSAQVKMGDQAGLYHIRIWVTVPVGDIQAVDAVIWVGSSSPKIASTPTPATLSTPIPTPIGLQEAPKVGSLSPDFSLETLQSQTVTLSSLRGRPTIILFWASWCPYCREEITAFQNVFDEYQDRANFISINTLYQDSLSDINTLLGDIGTTFPVLLDKDGSVTTRYAINGLPTTFFISRNGAVEKIDIGPLTTDNLRTRIDALLAQAP